MPPQPFVKVSPVTVDGWSERPIELSSDTGRDDMSSFAGRLLPFEALIFIGEPTGRNPRHFTVVFDDLDPGVEALKACEHRSWINPYHED